MSYQLRVVIEKVPNKTDKIVNPKWDSALN